MDSTTVLFTDIETSVLFGKSIGNRPLRDCYSDMMSLSTIIKLDEFKHVKRGDIVYMLDPQAYFRYASIDRNFIFDLVHFRNLGVRDYHEKSFTKLDAGQCAVITSHREILYLPRDDVKEICPEYLDEFFTNYLGDLEKSRKCLALAIFLQFVKKDQLVAICATIHRLLSEGYRLNRLSSRQCVDLNERIEHFLVILIPLLIQYFHHYADDQPEVVTLEQVIKELACKIKECSRITLEASRDSDTLTRILHMVKGNAIQKIIADLLVELTRRHFAIREVAYISCIEPFAKDVYWSMHYPEVMLDYFATTWGYSEKACIAAYVLLEPSILLALEDEQFFEGFMGALRSHSVFEPVTSDLWESLKNPDYSATHLTEELKKKREAIANRFVKYFRNTGYFSCFKLAQRFGTLMVFKFKSDKEGERYLIGENIRESLDNKLPSPDADVWVNWRDWFKENERNPNILSVSQDFAEETVPLCVALQKIPNGNVLRSYFIFLLKAGNVSVLSDLVTSCPDGSKVFMNTILSVYKDSNIVNTGVVWFALHHLLFKCTSLDQMFKDPNVLNTIATAFCKSLNCTVSIGTMKMYYFKLKHLFGENDQKRIENTLNKRKEAELQFINCFYWDIYTLPSLLKTEFSDILKRIEQWHYVWITIFYNRLRTICRRDNIEECHRCLLIFRLVLANSSAMRMYFYNQGLNGQIKHDIFESFELEFRFRPDTGKMVTELCDVSFVDFQSREIRGRAIMSQFTKSQVRDRKKFPDSGEATVCLASVDRYAFPVVAKYFKPELINHLTEELDLLMRLHCHPHIVHLYGYIVEKEEFSGILMEYCKGGSVCKFIEKHPVSYKNETVLFWIFQASSALSYLHANGIFHRDIKPDNMLLLDKATTKDGIIQAPRHLKLTDFGVAKQFKKTKLTSGTVTCSVYGTPGFQAPESDDLEVFNAKMDIYSLGRSIWQLYFQKWPHNENVEDESVEPRITLPTDVEEFMKKLMETDPENRPYTEEVFDFFRLIVEEDDFELSDLE